MTTDQRADFLVSYSGGLVSWAAARRTAALHGRDRVRLLFADTLMEDEDLYRFLVEGAANVLGLALPDWLRSLTSDVPPIESPESVNRLAILTELSTCAMAQLPGLHWIMDGRNPFQVFVDRKFVGNSRVDPCSEELKRKLIDQWRNRHYANWRTILVFGLDWSERGRIEGRKGKLGHRQRMAKQGWRASYPMDERPYQTKAELQTELEAEGIRMPRLYTLGWPHNNCGGYCCKMGLAQAAHLAKTLPARYAWLEDQEQKAMEAIGPRAKPSLRYRSGGRTRGVSLRDFRLIQERQPGLFDGHGWGCGGGCAIDDNELPTGVAS